MANAINQEAEEHARPECEIWSFATVSSWRQAPPPSPRLRDRLTDARWERVPFLAFLLIFVCVSVATRDAYLMGFSVLFALLLEFGEKRLASGRARVAVSGLRDLPPVSPQFPVEVAFTADGVKYGTDSGIVTFDGDWLHYEGLQTSFSFNAAQKALTASSAARGLELGTLLFVAYRIGDTKFRTTLTPLDRLSRSDQGYRNEFLAQAALWLKAGAGKATALAQAASEQSVLPPLIASDRFVRDTDRIIRFGKTGTTVAVALLAVLYFLYLRQVILVGGWIVPSAVGGTALLVFWFCSLDGEARRRTQARLKREMAEMPHPLKFEPIHLGKHEVDPSWRRLGKMAKVDIESS